MDAGGGGGVGQEEGRGGGWGPGVPGGNVIITWSVCSHGVTEYTYRVDSSCNSSQISGSLASSIYAITDIPAHLDAWPLLSHF